MEEFINDIDPRIFAKTNSPWNQLRLNDPWSVGYVTNLILLKPFNSKEDWENFYYEMGEHRQKELQQLPRNQRAIFLDYNLVLKEPNKVRSFPAINLNTQHGRTHEELNDRGQTLYQYMQNIHPEVTLNDCIKSVRFRVICETWNGVVLREKNTIATLRSTFEDYEFRETTGERDHTFAVDCEVYTNSTLICGLQIKPSTYLYNTPYLRRAQAANTRKFVEYKKTFGVPIHLIISDTDGRIDRQHSGYRAFTASLK